MGLVSNLFISLLSSSDPSRCNQQLRFFLWKKGSHADLLIKIEHIKNPDHGAIEKGTHISSLCIFHTFHLFLCLPWAVGLAGTGNIIKMRFHILCHCLHHHVFFKSGCNQAPCICTTQILQSFPFCRKEWDLSVWKCVHYANKQDKNCLAGQATHLTAHQNLQSNLKVSSLTTPCFATESECFYLPYVGDSKHLSTGTRF